MGVHRMQPDTLSRVHSIHVHTCEQGRMLLQLIAVPCLAQQARVQCPPQSKPEPQSGSIEQRVDVCQSGSLQALHTQLARSCLRWHR